MAEGLRGANGVASPPFTKGPYAWDQFVAFTGGFGGVNTSGNVYYVKTTGGNDGNDGKSWTNALATIQAAVDKTGDRTGDVILVAPGKYQENVLITNAHDSLKIFAVSPGWETQMRPSDATTKYPATSVSGYTIPGFGFIVGARNCIIDGFCLDGGGGYGGIYVGDGYRVNTAYNWNSANVIIQNCLFRGGTEGNVGLLLDGCSDNVIVQNNVFAQWTAVGVQIDAGGSRTCQRPIIRYNEFIDSAGFGIDMYSSATTVGALVRGNSFSDGVSTTMTYGLKFQGAGVHTAVGNFFACTNSINGSGTDFIAGNFESSPAGTPLFVTED